jgi:hypothetical protein
MRIRTRARTYRLTVDVLESRDVPSSVTTGAGLLHPPRHLPPPVVLEALVHETPAAGRGAGAHHHAQGGHVHPGLDLPRLAHGKKKRPATPAGAAGRQGPLGPQGPPGAAGLRSQLIPYTLAPGQSTGPFTGSPSRPIFIIATNTTPGDQGTAFISLVHGDGTLAWSGITGGPAASETGDFGRNDPGRPIAQVDHAPNNGVELEVASGDAVVVHNTGNATQTGFVWVLEPPM